MTLYKNLVKKVSIPSGKKTKQSDYQREGLLKVVDQGHSLISGYTNDLSMQVMCELPVIVFGDHTRAVKYIDFTFAAGADGIKVLQPKDGILPKYLYYGTQFLVLDMENHGYARHYQYLEKKTLSVPEMPEQNRIVSRIEELFSDLDKAVETMQTIKQQLAVYRQAVLKEAFEGNLTASWRASNSYNFDWRVVSIRDVVKSERNALKAGPFGSALKKECYVSEGYKIYGQEQVISGDENFGDYYIDESKYQELIQCSIAPKDVLISLVGTVGKVLVLSDKCKPGIINPRLVKISLDPEKMLPEFFKHYFESAYLRSLYMQKTHGATMDVLNMGMIKQLPFPLCSIAEQRQVVREIKSRLAICESIECSMNAAVQQVDYMRKSILKLAFEGRI